MPKKPKKIQRAKKVSAATKSAQKSRRVAETKAAKKPADAPTPAARKVAAKEASIKTRLAKRGKAAPVLETAPDQVPASAQIELIAHNLLHLSDFNHRARDPQQLRELADSIAVDGVLQNLTARPHPKIAGGYEIVNGGRRWEAVQILIKAKRVPADYRMPVRVRDLTDLQVLRLVTVENIQRQDMHPLEEGEHFARLRDAGDTTENIARLIGKSQKWVQTRIALVDKLAPAAQSAFRDGALGLWAALLLTKEADPKRQTQLAAHVRYGYIANGQALLAHITAANPLVSAAHFDPAKYQGAIIEDEDGIDGPWFGDIAEFERLQIEAIEATKKKLAEKWAFVEVLGVGQKEGFQPWMWPKSKNRKEAGAVIEIGHGFTVTVHEGVLRPVKPETGRAAKRASGAAETASDVGGGGAAGEKAESGPDPLTAAPAVTQPLMVYAKQQKTAAIQSAIALSRVAPGADAARQPIDAGRGFKVALALSCMALMGDRTVCRIQPAEIRADDRVIAPLLAATLGAFRPKLKDVLSPVARGKSEEETEAADLELMPFSDDEAVTAQRAFELLIALPQEELQLLFAGLVASRCGSFDDYTPKLGDEPLTQRAATYLGVDMALAWGAELENWRAYLKLCKKSRLVRLVQHMPGLGIAPREAVKMKTGVLAGAIEQALEAHPEQRNCVPPELRFGDREAIEALLATTAPADAAEPAAQEQPKKRRGRHRGAKDDEAVRAESAPAAGEIPGDDGEHQSHTTAPAAPAEDLAGDELGAASFEDAPEAAIADAAPACDPDGAAGVAP